MKSLGYVILINLPLSNEDHKPGLPQDYKTYSKIQKLL